MDFYITHSLILPSTSQINYFQRQPSTENTINLFFYFKIVLLPFEVSNPSSLYPFMFVIDMRINVFAFFIWMRSVTYKHKQKSAFRHITDSSQDSPENQRNGKNESVCLIGYDCSQIASHLSEKTEETNAKPYSIFVMPVVKCHSRTDRDGKIIEIIAKYKQSGRNKMVGGSPEIKKGQSHSETYQFEKRETQHSTKNNVYASKKYNSNEKEEKREELEQLRKRNEKNLIGNIRGLRQLEKEFISMDGQEVDSLRWTDQRNKASYAHQKREEIKKANIEGSVDSQKEKLKEKIQLKQSRRHIYHTLQHKSQIFRRILPKYRHRSLKTHESPSLVSQKIENKEIDGLQCHANRCHFEKMPLNHLKNCRFLEDSPNQLRIESTQVNFDLHRRIKEEISSTLRHKFDKTRKIFNTVNDFRFEKDVKRELSLFEIQKDREEDSRVKEGLTTKQWRGKSRVEHSNCFRELTPWHTEDRS